MVVDKCKERLAKMPLDQYVDRWKRKKGSPFKEKEPTKYKWREVGSPNFKEIADMKKSDIRSATGDIIDESIQLAKIGVVGQVILIPSLEAVQETFTKGATTTDIKPEVEQKKAESVHRRKDTKVDNLDFRLHSTYVPGMSEVFPEKVDFVLQPITVGLEPLFPPIPKDDEELAEEQPDPQKFPLQFRPDGTSRFLIRSVPERGHPIVYGGLRDHVDVNSVKLGISSYHMPQTKNGFSRKVDGAFFSV